MRVEPEEHIDYEKVAPGLYWAKVAEKLEIVDVQGISPFLRCYYYREPKNSVIDVSQCLFVRRIEVPKG